MNTLRLNKCFMIIMLITLFAATNILSKTVTQDDQTINEFASILKQKVLLTNDQEAKVINIMSEMQKIFHLILKIKLTLLKLLSLKLKVY